VFAWTQNRVGLPAWFGAGTALAQALKTAGGVDQVRELRDHWPFWQTLLHNLELALVKSDVMVAEAYQDLAEPSLRSRFWPIIKNEREQLEQALWEISGAPPLASQPRLKTTVSWRNPLVDALNYLQIALLARYREDQDPAWLPLISQTMEGIALGLRNTG
jgi:phosphoenolpyruvate carboxylase